MENEGDKMKYNNIGLYHDLIYVLTEYFNGNNKLKILDLNNVPQCIRPFFYKGSGKCSYMENILIESCNELLLNDNISVIQEKVIDCEKTIKGVADFYFNKTDINLPFNDYKFIRDMSKEISKSDYPDEIKSTLYSLFIEPHKVVDALMSTILGIYSQLVRVYKNYMFSISKTRQEINQPEILKSINIPNAATENIIYSICLLDNECVKSFKTKDDKLLVIILGTDYKKTIERPNQLDLKELGYVLTEVNRLKIIEMMRINNEITIKQIEQELCLSGTNAYYHLSLMIKAGMVATRYEGRTVFYSLNKTYFKILSLKLLQYYE